MFTAAKVLVKYLQKQYTHTRVYIYTNISLKQQASHNLPCAFHLNSLVNAWSEEQVAAITVSFKMLSPFLFI